MIHTDDVTTAARSAGGSNAWLLILSVWIILFAVGLTLALALGIWKILEAF